MLCSDLVNNIDDYLDGALTDREVRAIEQHAQQCATCSRSLDERKTLVQSLAELPAEDPSDGFFERALEQATLAQPARKASWIQRSSRKLSAVAAVLLIAGVALQTPLFTPSREIPEVTITLHEVTPVNLRFASAADLKDARLSLQLPEGVELAGHTGRKSLSWRTDLKKGDNLLRLPLLGYVASSDRLVAELEHPEGEKTFELQITVN